MNGETRMDRLVCGWADGRKRIGRMGGWQMDGLDESIYDTKITAIGTG